MTTDKEELFQEAYSIEECNRLVKKGYKFISSYIKKEYAYCSIVNHMTLHDAYSAYIFIKEIK